MPENITERQHEKVGSDYFVPQILQTLTDEEYRESVRNIRAFFTLLNKWYSGLDAINGPGYDELRDNNDGGNDI
jgi:hypothetical protein